MSKTKAPSSYRKLFSNTLTFAIGSFSSKILVILLIPIYTNALSDAELGIADVLVQIANWAIPIASVTIAEAVIRFGLDKAYDPKAVFTIGNVVCIGGTSRIIAEDLKNEFGPDIFIPDRQEYVNVRGFLRRMCASFGVDVAEYDKVEKKSA